MGKELSRRSFLKNAAAGAAGLAALSVFNLPVTAEAEKWDMEVDVAIVGAGGTGVSAAAAASEAGASVLILEKAGIPGGTTNFSGGVMQAAGTKVQKETSEFQDDTPEKHAALWIKAGEGLVDEELVRELAEGAPTHIEWLTGLGLKFTSVYGHCHIPYVDDSLYADRIHVYEGGGGTGSGTILVQTVLNYALGLGAEIKYDTEATRLIQDKDGKVIGLEATNKGTALRVKANKGVILAAASVDQNLEMAKRLSPQQYDDLQNGVCMCAVTDTGDGIRMGQEVGADLVGLGGTIDFCGKTGAATTNKNPLFPSFIVNAAGRRFVCEDATYAYHYRAIYQQSKQLDGPTYMIFGQSSLQAPGAPWTAESAQADVEAQILKTADTIEELAEQLSLSPANLAATLAGWNQDMAAGADAQFGRLTGLEAIEGPFFAYKNMAFNLGAIGGLRINTNAQVIDVNGKVIPGLYAAGMNAGGWIGPYYPGSGTAIMGTIHFGRKAGTHAASL